MGLDRRTVRRQHMETAASWTTQPAPAPAPQAPAPDARVTVADATEAFLAKSRNRGVADPAFKKYQTFVKQLRIYCDERGYICLDQLTVIDMDRFYASWKDGRRARAKKA
jgi:hypothetical protein